MMEAVYRLWAISLQADLLILLVLAARFLLRRYPRIYSYCLWAFVGIRLLCPVWIESPFSLQPDLSVYSGRLGQNGEGTGGFGQEFLPQQSLPQQGQDAVSGAEKDAADAGQAAVQSGESGTAKMPEGVKAESTAEAGQDTEALDQAENPGFTDRLAEHFRLSDIRKRGGGLLSGPVSGILGIVYLIGVSGLLLFYLIQYLIMKRKVAAAVREKGNVWLCDRIASPFVMGIVFPRIYLPYGIKGREKKHILRHERTHIRHHDPLIRVIGTLCICLHWWNPLVWLAVRLMGQDMEMFCDETVLRHASLEERKSYARTLLFIAENYAEKESGFGAGLAFGESHTEKRVKNIMKKRRKNLFIVCLVAILAVFCAAALMTVPRAESEEGGNSSGGEEGTNPANAQAEGNMGSGEAGGNPGNAETEGAQGAENVSAQGGAADEGGITGAGQGAGNGNAGVLSDEDLAWLMEIGRRIPDFVTGEELNAAFWADYLFASYTSDFDREQVVRYSEQLGEEIPYIRVSYEEADAEIRQIFGKGLGEYGISPEALGTGGSLLYEDGSLFVSVSDSPSWRFSVENVRTADNRTEVALLKTAEDGGSSSRVMLYLLLAENERGFVLDGKEETVIPQSPEGRILENESYDIEMNPYGRVTFAVYAPEVSVSPYADVTFKLLRDGQEIYSFPQKGTGVREDGAVFEGMAAVAFPDLNGDGYTDVVTIAHYGHESGPTPPQARIFTYNPGGYFQEEYYLEDAYNFSREEKTAADIAAFAALPENRDYFTGTSIYGRWQITGYALPGVYALPQEEIDSYVGVRLEYGIDSLWRNTDGERSTVIRYGKETVTAEELEESYRISSASLGITAGELTYYHVNTEQDSLFGCFFYLTDSGHALIYYEGVFFEAARE